MKQKILIFNIMYNGHWPEYIRHIYEIAESDKSSNEWIIAIPQQMSKTLLELVSKDNIHIEYISEATINSICILRGFKLSYKATKLLKSYCNRFSPDKIFLPHLTIFIPSAIFMLDRKISVSGIIYKMFLCNKKSSIRAFFKRTLEWTRFYLAARSKRISKIFLLNDPRSSKFMNIRLHTCKFEALSDPYIPIPEFHNLRDEYGIDADKTMFVHLGPTGRKGTMQILDAIELTIPKKYLFFFAGRVNDDIRNRFFEKVNDLKEKGYLIHVKDEYCSYEFLGSLVYSSDYVLLPYFTTDASSGFLGYAAQFGKPVIGPDEGLLGSLINEYQLGKTISPINGNTIASAMESGFIPNSKRNTEYLETNSLSAFKKNIGNILTQNV